MNFVLFLSLLLLVLTAGSLRISGNTAVGRVEVYYDGQWGTICDDAWDISDANVVCRQLGYTRAKRAYSGATHGQGTGPIWMDDLGLGFPVHHQLLIKHNTVRDLTPSGWMTLNVMEEKFLY